MTDVSRAGRRGSAVAISSQPPVCTSRASAISQAWDGHSGVNENPGSSQPPTTNAAVIPMVTSRSGPAVGIPSAFALRKHRVKDAGTGGQGCSQCRVVSEGVVRSDSADQCDAGEYERYDHECRAGRSLPEYHPGCGSHPQHLGVGDDGCQAGSNQSDRRVPQRHVRCQEDPGGQGHDPESGGSFITCDPIEEEQDGECVDRSEQACRGRSHVGKAHEDRRKRDGDDADESNDAGHGRRTLGVLRRRRSVCRFGAVTSFCSAPHTPPRGVCHTWHDYYKWWSWTLRVL